jgi:hypothetical protein
MTHSSGSENQESPRGPRRRSTVAMPVAMHDMVTVAYDDWDEIWHASRTVTTISPGLPDDIESM